MLLSLPVESQIFQGRVSKCIIPDSPDRSEGYDNHNYRSKYTLLLLPAECQRFQCGIAVER